MTTRNVLVVDDDEDFAATLALVLEGENFRVRVEHSGEKALEAFQSGGIDAVIIDIGLPGMSGLDCATRLRETSTDVVIVLTTGYSITAQYGDNIDTRDFHALTKPFDPGRLVELLG